MKGIQEISIIPGIPIRPALAERLNDAESILQKIGPCAVQPKLDGIRLQIHIDKRKHPSVIRLYSRNLLELSPMFPDIVSALHDFPVQTLIVEGEAICINPKTGDFLPFQMTIKRKRKYDIEKTTENFPIQLYLFDILFFNGSLLFKKPHSKR